MYETVLYGKEAIYENFKYISCINFSNLLYDYTDFRGR